MSTVIYIQSIFPRDRILRQLCIYQFLSSSGNSHHLPEVGLEQDRHSQKSHRSDWDRASHMTWCIQPEESSISSSRTQPNTNVSLQNTYKYSFLQNDLISLNFDLLNSYDLNVTEQCISINEIVCLSVPRVLDHCLGGQPQDSLRPQQINCFGSTRK